MRRSLTRESIFEMFIILKRDFKDDVVYDNRFSFAMDRNLNNLIGETESLIKARKSSIPEFNEFESKRNDIIKKYVVPGTNSSFSTQEDEKKCQDEIIELTKVYEKAIADRTEEVKLYNEILTEEIEVDIVQAPFKSFPQLNRVQMRALRPMFKETDEQIAEIING